jgi:hypothetical protein
MLTIGMPPLTEAAPLVLGFCARAWLERAAAPSPSANVTASANAPAARIPGEPFNTTNQPFSSVVPTGLADGLALKEIALRQRSRRFAPRAGWPQSGSPLPGRPDAPGIRVGLIWVARLTGQQDQCRAVLWRLQGSGGLRPCTPPSQIGSATWLAYRVSRLRNTEKVNPVQSGQRPGGLQQAPPADCSISSDIVLFKQNTSDH